MGIRQLLSVILSFQLILPTLAGPIGEKEEFKPRKYLMSSMAKSEAARFDQWVRDGFSHVEKNGLLSYAKKIDYKFSNEDKKLVNSLSNVVPIFVEKSAGYWEFSHKGHKVSFTLAQLYEGYMKVNDQMIKVADVPFPKLEKRLQDILNKTPSKTSYLKIVIENLFLIPEAEAVGPLIVILAALLLGGFGMWGWKKHKIDRDALGAQLLELKKKLDEDARTCSEAATNQEDYNKTYDLAVNLGERKSSVFNSPTEVLELGIKEHLLSRSQESYKFECHRDLYEAGKELHLDIPRVTPAQLQRAEDYGFDDDRMYSDINGAVLGICKAYDRLGACMERFISSHGVNTSELGNLKEQTGRKNFYEYNSRALRR